MQRSTTNLAVCFLVAVPVVGMPLRPTSAGAQGFTLTPFAAVNHGLDAAPRTVGLAGTLWGGVAGLRLGGAMDLPSSPLASLFGYPPTEGTEAWSADADLILSAGRAGFSLLGVRPSAFVGFGVHGRRAVDGGTATIPAWSYGVGGAVPLGERFSLDVEGRYRMPHESDEALLPPGVGGGWELRGGLSLHLGSLGASRSRPTRSGPGGVPRTIRLGGRAGGGAPPAGSRDWPRDPTPRGASAAAVAASTLETADRYVGVGYVWGGETPSAGFDCSGFVQYVFARNGIRLPRVSRDQRWAGEPVPTRVSGLLPGDLMFYAGSDGVVNHVAIYAGDDRIIHSSSSRGGVAYDDLSSRRGRYYATRMVAARRVIPEGGLFLLPSGR
jgi:NlpC/P60 family